MNLEPKTPFQALLLAGAIGTGALFCVLGAIGFMGAAIEKVRREWNQTAGELADKAQRKAMAKEGGRRR